MRRLVAAVALVTGLVAAAPADAAKRTVPYGFHGAIYAGAVEDRAGVQAAAWDRMALAGVESARIVFHWGLAQPEKRGTMRWARTDRAVAAAAARNIAILPVLSGTPAWAKQYPGQPASPPARFSDYVAYAAELVKRYGPNGNFWNENPYTPKRPLRHWQIWNEPELTDHWYREGKWLPKEAKRYGALLRGTARAIRAADPGAKVVLAGLTNFAWESIDALYRHAGIRGYFDVAAVHMFPGKWRNVGVIVERFRRAMDRRGGGRIPIWVTEMAWPAAKGRAQVPPWADTPYYRNFVTTEKGAAERLERAYALLGARRFRTKNRLQRVHWFTSLSPFSGNVIWDYSGLMKLEGDSIKPVAAYGAFQRSARKGQGCAKNAAGGCR